ncbi:Fimbrial assembly family protein [Caldicellulosiruptor kronotskyensis 2002]|uniref:Fimbrial assembly family protein n=1 Tax=Caldicellulosiruptor kronotskyensis (strain DSM 18902 / VKM B-2412 / 2002) TaxID=632348 RepID=E4SDB2_CALK2|nr:PilN domain-containing protein [Caldicellulosiruptor kronotskyensis]ADQ45721.1 Fimbrial assembly family protein [Caldicellulosiruptor kronotskyensis 2002]
MPVLKDINLLEAYSKQYKVDKEKVSGGLVITLLSVIGVCVLISVFIFIQIISYSMKISSTITEINSKKIIVNKIQKDLRIKEAYDMKIGFINQKKNENLKLKELLTTLEKLTPIDLTFEMLQIENNKLNCRVASKNVESVVQFVYSLSNDPHFANVVFNGANDVEGIKKADVSADIR